VRRLRYWEETQLVAPSISRKLSLRNTVRLYSFQDMLALLVVAWLRTEHGMSLQHIRRVIAHLHARGYHQPLREQIVLEETIRLDPLRTRISRATQRPAPQVGQIITRRGVMGNKPIFAGTRIPVATVQRYLDAGYDTKQIIKEYPALTPADIKAARNYAA
jgi:uncharacterized protein (DUF433 family)